MKSIYYIVFFSSIGCLSGCATGYKEKNIWDGLGYEDKQVSEGIYEVSFLGNAYTDPEDVKKFWYRRASELCGHSNYKADMVLGNKLNTNYGGAYGEWTSHHEFPLAKGIVDCNAHN